MRIRFYMAVLIAGVLGLAQAAYAQEASPAAPKSVPYDDELLKLSETLGALHFLRNLCSTAGEDQWRGYMDSLLQTETAGEPDRRAQLTAAFNRGYRTFSAIHKSCSPETREIAEKYRVQGATLSAEIAARFGN